MKCRYPAHFFTTQNQPTMFLPHLIARQRHPFLLAAALFLISINASSQASFAVAPSKMNVLYIGVDNPVTVAASNSSEEQVSVTVSGGNGTVEKLSAGQYNVRVATITNDCRVNVFVDGKLVGTSPFRVRSLPQPTAVVGGYPSGTRVKAQALRAQAGLGLFVKDFPFELRFEVVGFTLNITDEKGNVQSAASDGPLFSDAAKKLMEQHLKAGSTVTIDKIVAKDASGRSQKLSPITYPVN